MMAVTDDSRQHGFALLEILIALMVLGFLFVGLAQGVHFGLFASATEARLTSGNDDFNTLDNTLRHLIEVADPGDDLDFRALRWEQRQAGMHHGTAERRRRDGRPAHQGDASGRCRPPAGAAVAARHACEEPAGAAGADRDRTAARRIERGAGILAARQRLGHHVALTRSSCAGACPTAFPATRFAPLAGDRGSAGARPSMTRKATHVQRGFALLIVLWTLPLLALLGTQLLATSRQDTQLARNLLDAAVLEAAAKARCSGGLQRARQSQSALGRRRQCPHRATPRARHRRGARSEPKRTRSIRTSPRPGYCRLCWFRSVPTPRRPPRWRRPSSNGV